MKEGQVKFAEMKWGYPRQGQRYPEWIKVVRQTPAEYRGRCYRFYLSGSTYPAVSACLTWLKQFGDARMSGSGASVFLEVTDEQVANEICSKKPKEISGFVAKGLDQHPLFKI